MDRLICRVDRGGFIHAPNARFIECFGVRRRPETPQPFGDLIHPADRALACDAAQRAADGSAVSDLMLRGLTAEGICWTAWSFVPVPDKQGVYAIGRAESPRQDAAQSREIDHLRTELDALEQTISVLAHELRTPLTALQATSEVLLTDQSAPAPRSAPALGSAPGAVRGISETASGIDPQTADRFLRTIHDETLRMGRFINNLLEATRLNSGVAHWNWGRVPLVPACEAAMDTIRPLLASDVTIRLEAAGEPVLSGDADAIQRLLVNLLHNAAKHTETGEIVVRVDEQCDADGPRMCLQVRDTGEGMPPEVAEKLGQPFALNAGVIGGGRTGGCGLGVAICQGIAAAHGGRMSVETRVGRGTTFHVSLRTDLPGPAPVKAAWRAAVE